MGEIEDMDMDPDMDPETEPDPAFPPSRVFRPHHPVEGAPRGWSRAKPRPLIKAAEFAAAIQEKLPSLPPITHMPHISLHSQPPHGVVLKPEPKSTKSLSLSQSQSQSRSRF